jgi:alpha-L-fucosidase
MRILIFLLLLPGFSLAQSPKDVLPSSAQLDWAEQEIGALFHFDVVNYVPDYDWRKWGTHPPASVFNPSQLDTDQWLRAAKAAGAKYAVLVAKHCSGFSLWPTEAHDYSVKSTQWKNGKGDIVADFIASCKKYGIKPGIYASASANGFCYVDNPGKVQTGSPFTQEQYNNIVIKQLTELWTNYGRLFEIWFDGGVLPVKEGGPDLAPLLKKLQPDAVIFQGPSDANNLIRWIGNEDGLSPYPNWSRTTAVTSATGTIKIEHLGGNPEGAIWCPGEADFPLRNGWQGGWFWKKEGQQLLSTDHLIKNYITSVGRNSNMLIGIVVDTSGRVPPEDLQRLQEFGDEIRRRFTIPVAETKGNKREITLTIAKHDRICKYIVIQEDISKGERIREYTVQALIDGKWVQIAEGSSVGHKRIHELENPVSTRQLKLSVISSAGEPVVKKFAVF